MREAWRRLGRSPAAVTRAVAFLEGHVGVQLLYRTTRALRLTEAGERYAATCHRVLTDLEEADISAAGERAAPRGLLTITAPVMVATHILRPSHRVPEARARRPDPLPAAGSSGEPD
jgi:DNA-binding transcriptional LysR family regulator